MSSILDKIRRGSADLPPRVVLAGPEGIGKSTFGSKAPNPLFICAEDGLTGLDHVQRFSPANLTELHAMLDQPEITQFKTIVVDTTDWMERLICRSVCVRDGKEDVESYGYGKGYVVMENELVNLLHKFDALRHKGMGIILLSHVQIRTFTSPEGESYDRYEMKGHKRFTGILREWPDCLLFATFEVFKTKVKGTAKEKTVGGSRIIHTQWSPAWDAKNRLNLPETIDLEWDAFEAASKENSTPALIAKAKAAYAVATIPEASKAKWEAYINKLDTLTADKIKAAIEAISKLN